MRELQQALQLHEAGRESLKARLAEQHDLLDKTRILHADRIHALEALRTQEMKEHDQRISSVRASISAVLDQMRRARLSVDDWARATKGYESLGEYLQKESEHATAFASRQLAIERDEFSEERAKAHAQLATMEAALSRAGAERIDLQAACRKTADAAEARRVKEAETEATVLRERLREAGVAARTREEAARDHLLELKNAFRTDVGALAAWVEQLRGETLTANVYARSSTRLLRQQNIMIKRRLGHNALVAKQKQRRLIAWLGWRLVVQQSKALAAADARRSLELGERESMLDTVESKLGHTRQKYLRQLHTLQAAHEAELGAAEEEINEAHGAMARLKTFSAHKLSELAEQLEHAQLAAANGGVAPTEAAATPPPAEESESALVEQRVALEEALTRASAAEASSSKDREALAALTQELAGALAAAKAAEAAVATAERRTAAVERAANAAASAEAAPSVATQLAAANERAAKEKVRADTLEVAARAVADQTQAAIDAAVAAERAEGAKNEERLRVELSIAKAKKASPRAAAARPSSRGATRTPHRTPPVAQPAAQAGMVASMIASEQFHAPCAHNVPATFAGTKATAVRFAAAMPSPPPQRPAPPNPLSSSGRAMPRGAPPGTSAAMRSAAIASMRT